MLFTLDVDGEVFAVRRSGDDGWSYEWSSGPNEGYGFAVGGPPIRSQDEHGQHIRGFLAMIDPETGYIEDE